MEHNASALYYAALCGHLDVCEYLLAAGARLEAGEFVGERVFYAVRLFWGRLRSRFQFEA